MSDATPEQIALADRICREQQPCMAFDAALAAIIETQRLDAQLTEMIGTKYDRTGVPVLKKSNRVAAVAIRKGEHYYG